MRPFITAERWRQIEELFEAARLQPAERRSAMMAAAGPAVRDEVHRMLVLDSETQWLDGPAPMLDPDATLTLASGTAGAGRLWAKGARLGQYEIEARLSWSGVGEKLLAIDRKLLRRVELHLMPPGRLAEPAARERFRRAALAARALTHANIAAVYEAASEGQLEFLVTERAPGNALSGMIPSEGLPPERVALYGSQIAAALGAAHRAGLAHGDIQAGNVVLLPGERVRVLGFGAAGLFDEAEVNAAGDMRAFGQLLTHMATGEPHGSGLPVDLEQLVALCLAPQPAVGRVAARSVAVLAFSSLSSSSNLGSSRLPPEVEWGERLAAGIAGLLDGKAGIEVASHESALAFCGKGLDVRAIAHALRVAHLLEGSVRRAGNRARVTVQLVRASDGAPNWSERYELELAETALLPADLARTIADEVHARLVG